jgi:hypothetical protein
VWQHLRQLNPELQRNAVADLIARTCNGNGEPNRDAVDRRDAQGAGQPARA